MRMTMRWRHFICRLSGISGARIAVLLAVWVGTVHLTPAALASGGLSEVLMRVESRAPALEAALAEARAAGFTVRSARARYRGELDVFIRDSHFNDPRLVIPLSPPIDIATIPFDDDQFGYGAIVALPLDVNGRIGAHVESARHAEEAAGSAAEDLRLRLLNLAATLYRELQRLDGRRQALFAQRAALAAHIKVAEAAVNVGRLAPVERLRLSAELKDVEGEIAGVSGSELSVRARIAELMAMEEYDDPVVAPQSPPEVPAWSETSAQNRPDIQAAEANVTSAQAQARGFLAERFPDLVLAGAWRRDRGYDTDTFDIWQVSLAVRWNVWDGGGRRADVLAARERQVAAEQQVRTRQLQANAEFKAARAQLDAAQARIEAARKGLAAAEETSAIQADRFNAGRLSAADLVDAEATLSAARAEAVISLADWWNAYDDLRLALGKPPAALESAGQPEKNGGARP